MRYSSAGSWPTKGLVALTVVLISACQFKGAAPSKRAPSLRTYADVHIQGQKIEEFVLQRTARLISRVEKLSERENGYTGKSSGTVTPITNDGYFLTAAHALSESAMVIQPNGDQKPKFIRVVWNGRAEGTGVDLALVHAPFVGLEFFALAHDQELDTGRAVVGCGYGTSVPSAFAGILTEFKKEDDFAWLSHDGPVRVGDSGGPLLSLRGRLLGINVSGSYNPLQFGARYSGCAVRPSIPFILDLIERDRIAAQSTQ